MKFVRSFKKIYPTKPNGKTIVYMLGYGGYIWQAKRHISLLKSRGYTILAIDFTHILKTKDPKSLNDLIDETAKIIEDEKLVSKDTLLVGISLGGLVGFNLIKRYKELNKLLVITGGDITHLPSKHSLKKDWNLTRKELSKLWEDVNIYTPVGQLKDKYIIMVLPKRDRVIDPEEVANEISKHTKLNNITLINTTGGHFRTIITETIISPKRSIQFIEQLWSSDAKKTS